MKKILPFITLFKMELIAWLRIKINFFFIIIWPLLWMFMMAFVIPASNQISAQQSIQYYFPSGMLLVILSAMISLSIRITMKKEAGILQRLKVVPFPIVSYFVVQLLCCIAVSVIGLLCISLMAIVFKMQIAGSLFSILVLFLLGCFVFSSIGFFISGISMKSSTANILSMLVMFIMMFISDMFIPLSDIQSFIYKISIFLPASPFLAISRSLMISGGSLFDYTLELLILVSWGSFFLIASFFTFKFSIRK